MRDITIKITGKRFVGEETEEEMEFVSDAKMYDRNGARYFLYDESEFSGFPGCKTSLKLTEKRLRMKRMCTGEENLGSELIFEEGKRFVSRYNTPYGAMDMEVLTTAIKNELSPEGFGRITLDYNISLQGLSEGRNRLDIEILQ